MLTRAAGIEIRVLGYLASADPLREGFRRNAAAVSDALFRTNRTAQLDAEIEQALRALVRKGAVRRVRRARNGRCAMYALPMERMAA